MSADDVKFVFDGQSEAAGVAEVFRNVTFMPLPQEVEHLLVLCHLASFDVDKGLTVLRHANLVATQNLVAIRACGWRRKGGPCHSCFLSAFYARRRQERISNPNLSLGHGQ